MAAASGYSQRRVGLLRLGDPRSVQVGKLAVDPANLVHRSVLRHEQRNLMSLIEIIEIHKILPSSVSGSTVGLSVAWAYGNNIRDDQDYHTEMISPNSKIIFHGRLQLFGNTPIHSVATSRKLTVFGRFSAHFPSLFAPSRKRADLRPRH